MGCGEIRLANWLRKRSQEIPLTVVPVAEGSIAAREESAEAAPLTPEDQWLHEVLEQLQHFVA
jgi:hypothetical protein